MNAHVGQRILAVRAAEANPSARRCRQDSARGCAGQGWPRLWSLFSEAPLPAGHPAPDRGRGRDQEPGPPDSPSGLQVMRPTLRRISDWP